MKNGDSSAYPMTFNVPARDPKHPLEGEGGTMFTTGVTKREYFAAMALQGYIAAGSMGMPSPKHLAEYATDAADALLSELDKTQTNES